MIWENRVLKDGEIRYRHKFCWFPYTWRYRFVERTYWLIWITVKEEWKWSKTTTKWLPVNVTEGKLDLTNANW